MKTKFQLYKLNRPNCTLWMNFIGGQGWYTGHHPSGQTRKGDISYNHPLYDCAQLGSRETNVKCSWGCASGGILSVRCNAGPAEGPGKILKYRSNLWLYLVNFSNKLCIWMFIILSIWPNLFDPHFTMENFLITPFRQLKTFLAPLHFAQPPHQSIYEHSLKHPILNKNIWVLVCFCDFPFTKSLSAHFVQNPNETNFQCCKTKKAFRVFRLYTTNSLSYSIQC